MTGPLLQIDGVSAVFGTFRAVDGVTLSVNEGTITGLIGPNGAGKSTLFNTVAGEKDIAEGQVLFKGARIDGLPPEAIFTKGLARTFQIPRPFAEMTVLENLMLAAPEQIGEAFWNPILSPRRIRVQEREIIGKAREVLAFTTLDRVAQEAAGRLSGGQQKLLELARVLMVDPTMILLDEPAAGVNPALARVLIEKIEALNARGVTFLIVEHDMDLVMRHCDPIIAMAGGRVIFEGDAAAARQRSATAGCLSGGRRPCVRPRLDRRRRDGRIQARIAHPARRVGGCRCGRDRHADRTQRCRQIDAGQGDRRFCPCRQRNDHGWTASRSSGSAPTGWPITASPTCRRPTTSSVP